MSSMREAFKQHALLWGGYRGPFVSEEEEQEEIRLFATRLSKPALQECLLELASWTKGDDLTTLTYGAEQLFDSLRDTGRGPELGRAALNVITNSGPPGAISAFQEARVPEQIPDLIQKVDWRNGSAELQIAFAGALGVGGRGAKEELQQMRAAIRNREVRAEIDIALHNISVDLPVA
jgi:hypothetical protein